ncbi:MAG: hypothetical protein JWN38_93 [Candidatus Saccharibacteria bacterium]|nr:hypothetical protein [Candidatus Saccharibacteria bacterium]
MQTTHSNTITIPEGDIADVEAFEALRQATYAEAGRDPDEFTALTEGATLTDGSKLSTRFDSVLEADDPAVRARIHADNLAAEVTAATEGAALYDFILGPNFAVTAIHHRIILPMDEHAVEAQKRMADGVGYGPKQNDASFRTSGVVPRH